MQSNSQNLSIGADLSSQGTTQITTQKDTLVVGNIQSEGALNMQAGGNINAQKSVTAGSMQSNSQNLHIGADLTSRGTTQTATQKDTLVVGDIQSQGALSMQAGGNINAQKSVTAASVQTNSQNLNIGADLSSGGQTRLGTAQKIQIGGQLNSQGGLLVRAGGNVDIGKGIAAGSIDLQGQNVTVGNTMTSSGAMLADTASLQVGGDIQSGQDMRIKGNTGGVTAKTIVSLQNLNLTAQGPIATDNISAKHLRTMVWAMLQRHHKDATEELAGDLLSEDVDAIRRVMINASPVALEGDAGNGQGRAAPRLA
jgi:filamentous hemagglutinin